MRGLLLLPVNAMSRDGHCFMETNNSGGSDMKECRRYGARIQQVE